MEAAPAGMHPQPESLTQILLSFSSPCEDTNLGHPQEDEEEQVGDVDSEAFGSKGGSWVRAENRLQPHQTTTYPSPCLDDEPDPQNGTINGDTELTHFFSDTETQGEIQDFEMCSTTPSWVGKNRSGNERCDSPLVCIQNTPTLFKWTEATTANLICVQKSGQEQCTWKRRIRLGKIPDQREPKMGRACALEKAMRSYVDQKSGQVVAPEIGREFDSLAEAFEFYNLYSWEIGFGIRYGQSRTNAQKSRTVQDIVCGCAGRPKKENTNSVACNCQALIRLHRTNDNGWYIHDFRSEHNHHLSSSCGEKLHWPSHRNIDTNTKDIVKHLMSNNIGLTKVFCVIASFFGSMENVPFNKRSLKYMCTRMNQETADDDIRKTIDLFSELKKNDPMFSDSVLVDSDSKIQALMWTNGKSRYQYKMFGDAITFDTTYRTNQYDMPFGLFVGVNHHF
ncbi:protein FAR1-RELATED SEQUENCE 5-like [Hordeum vulgare subsp. vulgare]|uniref:FAR1 domain-containing protein n=1 Tax=Hordeum vulgare subsp. vulgare TaxID=112509 RepID=A0A8I6WZB3_HORVV|nr:protein FAR1-RELATED SEQUENCE 5-like [Hordeum vulgare subsp. vulgare]XP_044972142.1 protein FAR1-RELATED SEQUENCE 5-like [Hordeum vulgare subsp. vulgare]XP_044972143.1 protein FAR1-RELATED SEQUENCE 5-like [Hordeum vulgare subsp. vulgare]XP_044972144.1 protein FAR1-RELATED SEQUENCE 5-like [Hordeum vulgare subsp. vulgare]